MLRILEEKRDGKVVADAIAPEHRCYKNFPKTLASKVMEPQAAVKITTDIANSRNGVYIQNLLIDDDTTTMAQLQNRKNGGYLPDNILTPEKWADVGHRVRRLGRQMEELADMPMKTSRVNKQIAARVKKILHISCDFTNQTIQK